VKGVFGLGNPGSSYTLTRHNVGFEIVDLYRKLNRLRRAGRIEHECLVYRHGEILLCKPLTYMNASGPAVSGVMKKHGISPTDALVIYDELDLPLGRVKILSGGGAGTHKGMRSILDALGTDEIPRLKVGVEIEGRTEPGEEIALRRFTTEEWTQVVPALERAVEAIEAFRDTDIHALMTRFNRRDDGCRS
jgi:PTH1 family peptidyl-tRNA hydrolase